ncbi:aminotransferase DegT [Campylobacterota bacterium]|nr:aminotransferase DegT [Campylobacterota bacterium]
MEHIPFFKASFDAIEPSLLQSALNAETDELAEQLETQAAKMLGVPYVVAAANPSLALQLALTAVDIKRGDKLITSVNAHPALSQAIRQLDAEPVFADIDTKTFDISSDALAAKITAAENGKKLRGVLCNSLAGQSPDIEPLRQMTKERNLLLITESYSMIGADFMPSLIEKSDITVTSLLPIESLASNIGFIATHNAALRSRALLLRNHALKNSGGYIYDQIDVGCSYMPSPLDMAFALTNLPKAARALELRREIAAQYDRAFADLPHVSIPVKRSPHGYSSYIISIDKNRDEFARKLLERGVETALCYIPLHLMSYYRFKYALKITDYPRALDNYQHILSLPIYSAMHGKQAEYVIEAVKEIAEQRTW